MKYYSVKQLSNLLGVTSQTLRNWDKNGKLKPHHIAESGYRYYSEEQVNRLLGIKDVTRKVIGYCRVDSLKQKEDLDRQVEDVRSYLLAGGRPFEIITDIGSGVNYKNKGLRSLIKEITENKVDKIVILYKDRLLRFGYELIEYLASLYNCDIEVIDNTEKIQDQELVDDLIQIVTVFGYKMQGKRVNKAKKMIKELMKDDKS